MTDKEQNTLILAGIWTVIAIGTMIAMAVWHIVAAVVAAAFGIAVIFALVWSVVHEFRGEG